MQIYVLYNIIVLGHIFDKMNTYSKINLLLNGKLKMSRFIKRVIEGNIRGNIGAGKNNYFRLRLYKNT
jgi:hypothetical protein